MIITIKTLQNKRYDLDIDPKNTVAEIKEKIHKDLSLGEPESQKLIHHGKILKDDQTAESAGFKEKDFLVVMVRKVKKRKPAKKDAEPVTNPPTNPTPATGATDANSTETGPQAAQEALVTGSQLDETIANLMGMGFEREQCVRALRAAFNNPDRAVEYLLTVRYSPIPYCFCFCIFPKSNQIHLCFHYIFAILRSIWGVLPITNDLKYPK